MFEKPYMFADINTLLCRFFVLLKCRRQVFWISKQILQLIMEDAIDDWLLRQIHWLRTDAVIAEGIRWVQDVSYHDC